MKRRMEKTPRKVDIRKMEATRIRDAGGWVWAGEGFNGGLQSPRLPAKKDFAVGSSQLNLMASTCLPMLKWLLVSEALHSTLCFEQAEGIDCITFTSPSDRELQTRSHGVNAGGRGSSK